MQNFTKDIEAEVVFILPEEGGRKGPVVSGMRPQFFYDGRDWDASLFYESEGPLPKGKLVNVFFDFMHPQFHIGKLYPGKEFQLRDGNKVIANGRVSRIIDLENSANEQR